MKTFNIVAGMASIIGLILAVFTLDIEISSRYMAGIIGLIIVVFAVPNLIKKITIKSNSKNSNNTQTSNIKGDNNGNVTQIIGDNNNVK